MRRALLAADASAHSLRAAKLLGDLARKDPELMITILHVVPLPEVLTPAAAAGAPLTLPSRLEDYMKTHLTEILRLTVEALGVGGDRVKTMHAIGTAAESILTEAKHEPYEMIVMGRRGLSPLKEMLLGSVSQAVLHRAHIPVLIVP